MDGVYWVGAVPGLHDFYIPTQVISSGDTRPEVQKLIDAYVKKYGSAPSTEFGFPIYAWLDMWKTAVEAAGTTKAQPVVAQLERSSGFQTILGPRIFTPKLHVQTQIPLIISSYIDGKQTYVGEYKIGETIPEEILYHH